jgi:protein-L-isoaspartate(D-aspartate) O-methyltransferase
MARAVAAMRHAAAAMAAAGQARYIRPMNERQHGQPDGRRDERRAMVTEQIARRGISDRRVIEAMERVPRHLFVPEEARPAAYEDHPLPIGEGQTISQPYIVAAMLAAAEAGPGKRLLDVGTGCGYAAAVALETGAEVWSIERREALAYQARARLMRLGYGGVRMRQGNGLQGWADFAPFDAILVAAATAAPPPALCAQLSRQGGRMVLPIGGYLGQWLSLVTWEGNVLKATGLEPVRFVPLLDD